MSLSKTPNSRPLWECCSWADPVFWPPCTVGANSPGSILPFFFSLRHIDHPTEEFYARSLLSIGRSACGVGFGTAPLENGRGFIGLFKDTPSAIRKKEIKPVTPQSHFCFIQEEPLSVFLIPQRGGYLSILVAALKLTLLNNPWTFWGKCKWLLSLHNFLSQKPNFVWVEKRNQLFILLYLFIFILFYFIYFLFD